MTPDIDHELRSGNTSLELSAAICVELGHVPRVPEARAIGISNHGWIIYKIETGGSCSIAECRPPDLLKDPRARAEFERAMGAPDDSVSIEHNGREWYVCRWPNSGSNHKSFDFLAPTEDAARVGAAREAVKAMREG